MQKEIVTLENVKQDIRAVFRENFILDIRCIFGLLFAFLIHGWIFSLSGRGNGVIIITLISTVVVFVTRTLFFVMQINKVKQGKITVERDVVVDKRGVVTDLNYKGSSILFLNNIPRFFFSQGSVFLMKNIDYYKWSNAPRSMKTVFDMTDIGDMFLIIRCGGRIRVVYNERFFDTGRM